MLPNSLKVPTFLSPQQEVERNTVVVVVVVLHCSGDDSDHRSTQSLRPV